MIYEKACFAISKPAVFFCQKLAPSYLTFLPSTVSLFAGRLSFTGVVGVSGHTGKTMESRSVGHVLHRWAFASYCYTISAIT